MGIVGPREMGTFVRQLLAAALVITVLAHAFCVEGQVCMLAKIYRPFIQMCADSALALLTVFLQDALEECNLYRFWLELLF